MQSEDAYMWSSHWPVGYTPTQTSMCLTVHSPILVLIKSRKLSGSFAGVLCFVAYARQHSTLFASLTHIHVYTVSRKVYLCVSRISKILSVVIFFGKILWHGCVVAFGGYVNCACVPLLFQQLINIMLRPAFFRKFDSQPLCCVPL